MRNAGLRRAWALIVLAGLALTASGCRPLIGVRVVVRVDERTRLEREALGSRPEPPRGAALLPSDEVSRLSAAQAEALLVDQEEAQRRLAGLPAHGAPTRAWEIATAHNRSLLLARLGREKESRAALAEALARAEAFRFSTLKWQILQTMAEVGGEAGAGECLAQAADTLLGEPLVADLDYALESRERRERLYARLVSLALEAGEGEEALRCALEHEAVELARAVPPGARLFAGGPMSEAQAALEGARRAAAAARDRLCRLARDDESRPAAEAAYDEAARELTQLAGGLRGSSPLAGLLVPDPADPLALMEELPADALLLLYEPLGRDRYAAFLIGQEVFRVEQVALPADAVTALGRALLEPLAEDIGQARRLYIVPTPSLSAVPWQSLRVAGAPLAERLEVAFLGGAGDLLSASAQRHFGRDAVLACGPSDLRNWVVSVLDADSAASFFETDRRGKADLPEALAFPDVLLFTAPLDVRRNPLESHLAWPDGLGTISGAGAGELAAYETRAACAAFADVSPAAFDADHFAAVRALTRALMAAGVPSVVLGVGGEGGPRDDAYWRAFLGAIRTEPVSAAHRRGLAALSPERRGACRLYGFLGMDRAEYEEASRLRFNDVARAANGRLNTGRYRQAAAGFLDLAYMAQAVGFESDEQGAFISAQIEQQLVQCFRALGEYDQAVAHQESLIGHLGPYEGERGPLTAVAYQSLGALLTEGDRFAEAAGVYAHAIELFREQGARQDTASTLGELGKSLDRAADYTEAIESFRDALAEYEGLRRPDGMARQHQRIGAVYLRRLDDAQRAEEHFRRAEELFASAGDAEGRLGATIDLGLCRRAVADFPGAFDTFERALAEAHSAGLGGVEARALSEIANTRWLRGDYQDALVLVQQSNRIARELDDAYRLNVNHQLTGLVYWELNDFERALDALDRAIEAARRAQAPLEVASAFNNRGIVLRRQGRYEDALASFERALETDVRLRTRWGQAYDRRNIGMTLHRMGRRDEASPHLERAVELSRSIGDRVNLAKSLLALGELRSDEGREEESRLLLKEALQHARDVYLPEVEWRALHLLGGLERGTDDAAALAAFAQAVDVIEALRGGLKLAEFQSGFLTNKTQVYEDTVSLLLEMGRPAEAFAYGERSRARRFMDLLAGRRFDLRSDLEQELYDRHLGTARRLRAAQESLLREGDPGRRADLSVRLEELQREFEDLLIEVRVASPGLSGFVTVEVAEPSELARDLPADLSVIVYYVMSDELAAWVFRDGRLHVRSLPIDREQLEADVRAYRVMVQERGPLGEVLSAAQALHDLLIAPVGDLIEGSSAVAVVPHGALHYLSFASLHDGEAFLVEHRPLFYAPSASALRAALSADAPAATGELNVLAVGNPAVGDPALELPFAEWEVTSIRRDFAQVTVLTGREATEDWVKQNIGRFDVVHIGAHGQLDPLNPLFSSLALAPGEGDGLLHLHEVTGLRLRARLVGLSACQSGVGELRAGDELVSLSRAFAFAGTRAVLSTLWRVDDVSTALVSKHFYRHYADHGAAVSLRHAQLQVMNDGRHYHPSYWAGLTLSGDYR